MNLNNLETLYIYFNPITNLVKTNQTLKGLENLKLFYIPTDTYLNEFILSRIIENFDLTHFKNVLNIDYFEMKLIASVPLKNTTYTEYECYFISNLLKYLIFFNLKDDMQTLKYIIDCMNWIRNRTSY